MTANKVDSSQYCLIYWYDGLEWNKMDRISVGNEGLYYYKYSLSTLAEENKDFKIKFSLEEGKNISYFIDNVEVKGKSTLVKINMEINNEQSNSSLYANDISTLSDNPIVKNYNGKIYPREMYVLGEETPFSISSNQSESISPVSGNLILKYNDVVLKGKNGLDFVLTRYYNQSESNILKNVVKDNDGVLSEERNFSTFNDKTYNIGTGWAFDLPSIELSNGYPILHYGLKGTFLSASYNEVTQRYNFENYKMDDIYLTVDWDRNEFSNGVDSSNYILNELDGTKYYFNIDGRLIGKVDRFGNAIKFYHTKMIDEFNAPIYLLNKIIDSCNRQITFNYNFSSNIRINVYDGENTRSIQYNLAKIKDETSNNIDGYMPESKTVLKSIINEDGKTTSFTYSYEVVRASMLKDTIQDAEKNMYVNLSKGIHPTGAYDFYYYTKHEKDFGPTGRREYHRVMIRHTNNAKDYGSGKQFNFKNFSYQINDYLNDKTTINQTIDGHIVSTEYVYNNSMLVLEKKVESDDYKKNEHYEYSTNDTLKKSIVKNINKTTGKEMKLVNDYLYNSFGELIYHWNHNAERNSNDELVSPDSDKHKKNYTYTLKNHFQVSVEYWQDENQKVKIERVLSADGNKIEWVNTFINNVLKAKKQYVYDTYGNVIETRYYLSDNNFTNYFSEKTTYMDNQSRSQFNGAFLTRSWTEGIRDARDNLIEARNGNSQGTIDQQFYYDYLGNLIRYIDGEGNTTSYTYDVLNRKKQQTNPDNSTIKWGYTVNTSENSATKTDENNNKVKYIYDDIGKLVYVKDLTTSKILKALTYDTWSRVIKEIDGEGNWVEKKYRDNGLLKYEYFYDNKNNKIDENAYTYDCAYDNGNLSKEVKETRKRLYMNILIETVYRDKSGNIIKKEITNNGKTSVTTYLYDFTNNVISSKNPRAHDESWSETYTTKNEYDYRGNVIKSYNVLGDYVSNYYNSIGQLIEKRDIKGNKSSNPYSTLYKYDNLSRLIEEKVPFQQIGSTTYYQINRYYYDKNNNLIRKEISNNKAEESYTYSKEEFKYDNRNNLIQVTLYNNDNIESITQYYYDKTGNKVRTYTGLKAPLIITGLDNVTPTSDSIYSVTKAEFDHMNRIVKRIDALNQQETYSYDSNNQLISKKDRNGSIYTYTYRGPSDILSETVENSQTSESINKTYTYGIGRVLTSISDGLNKVDYIFDELGRLLKETEGNVTKEYTYDFHGNRITVIIKNDAKIIRSTNYKYDKLDRLTTVTENGILKATYTYDDNNNRKSLDYTNGNSVIYNYNLANIVTELINKQNNTELSHYNSTYTLDGNKKVETDSIGGKETNYIYDDLGRLITETNKLNSILQQQLAYTYDDAGNRATLVVSGNETYNIDYTYDLNNRLSYDTKTIGQDIETTQYSYDPNGNMLISLKETLSPSTGSEEKTHIYQAGESTQADVTINHYDLLNQLIKTDSNGNSAEYVYNATGIRISKKVNGKVTQFVLDGGNVIAELIEDQTTIYARGINLISRIKDSEEQFYLFNDHGDVIHRTNNAGVVEKTYDYDAFGIELSIDTNDNNPFRYSGEYYDIETGTYYLRARYYNPYIGRFITEDSYRGQANDPLSLNLYTYCYNNPVYYIDPTGHSGIAADSDIWMWLGEIIGQGAVQLGKGASAVSKVSPAVIAGWLFLDKFSIQAGETDEQIALIEQQYADDSFDIMDQYELEIQYLKDNRKNASKNLRNNMNSNGMKPPNEPNAAHHIVAYAAKKAAEAREKLTEFGVHVNDAVNGVFMKIAEHRRIHTNAYFEKVNKLLENVTTQEELVETLNDIAEQINNGTFLN